MARFCGQCGRPLAEGEVCNCQGQQAQAEQPQYNQSYQQQGFNASQAGQQFNQAFGKASKATKGLLQKIGVILKSPVEELKNIADTESSSLGVQMIVFNLAAVFILLVIAMLSFHLRLGEMAKYVNISYVKIVLIVLITVAIYYFAEAGILFGFTKAFSKGARITFAQCLTPIGGKALYDVLFLAAGVVLFLLNEGLGSFVIVAGFLFTNVLKIVSYSENVPLKGSYKVYVLGITVVCMLFVMAIVMALFISPAVKDMQSSIFGGFLKNIGNFY